MTKRLLPEQLPTLDDESEPHLPVGWLKLLSPATERTVLESWIVELPLDIGDESLYLVLSQLAELTSFGSDPKRQRLAWISRIQNSRWILAAPSGETRPIPGRLVTSMFFHDNTDLIHDKTSALRKAAEEPSVMQFRLSRHIRGDRSDMNFIKLDICIVNAAVFDYVLGRRQTLNLRKLTKLAIHQPLLEPPTNFSEPPLEAPLPHFQLDLWEWQRRNVNFLSRIENSRAHQLVQLSIAQMSKPLPTRIGASNAWLSVQDGSLSVGEPVMHVTPGLSIECRGGMICDPTSTGKSITIVASIWRQKLAQQRYSYFEQDLPLQPQSNFFKSSATLIICPTRLVKQWEDYFKKCLGSHCIADRIPKRAKTDNLVVKSLQTMRDFNRLTLKAATSIVDMFIVPLYLLQGKGYCNHFTAIYDLHTRANHEAELARLGGLLKVPGVSDFERAGIRHQIAALEAEAVYKQDWTPFAMSRVANTVHLTRQALLRQDNPVALEDITGFPLEGIFWQRKVIDEAHEIVNHVTLAKAALISRLESDSTWLLTATPNFIIIPDSSPWWNSRTTYAAMLGVKLSPLPDGRPFELHNVQQNAWTMDAFLRTWCRKSGAIAKRPVTEHRVEVTLRAPELALYHSRQQNSVAALLQFCSYHNELQHAADSDRVYSVSETTAILQRERAVRQDELQASAAELSHTAQEIWLRLRFLIEQDMPGFLGEFDKHEQNRMRVLNMLFSEPTPGAGTLAATPAICSAAKQAHTALLQHKQALTGLESVVRQQNYYASIVQLLSNSNELNCPIHYGPIPMDHTVLLSCGHYFCNSCLDACWHNQITLTCPACRHPIHRKRDLRIVDRRPPEVVPTQKEAELSDRFGSKIKQLVDVIAGIRQDPEQGKILVFAQWDHLLMEIGEALKAFQIKTAFPRGNISQINGAFNKFYTDDSVRVLLLSTRHNLSGSHLIEANNLIFVHPFPEAPEAALKEWEQAVSRMQRYGQQRDLHVWYMVTKNTVEVELEQRFALYKASELARQKRDEAPPIDAGNY